MTSDKPADFAAADRNLLQRVKGFLYQRCYGPHRALEVSVERGVVVVQGQVPTFYLRQVAVECIKRVAGDIQVIDLIQVAENTCQRQPNDNSKAEQEFSAELSRHGADVPGMTGTANCTPRSHYHRRHLFSSAEV